MSKTPSFLADFRVVLNPHVKLRRLYGKTLHLLRKLPRNVGYKINTEAVICHRLSIVEEAGDDVKAIEENIGCGGIQLLLRQAEEEFALVQKIIFWKPWEPLVEKPPPRQWDWPPN